MKHPRTHVTDHAVLRYLERVEGIDIEAVRRRIGHAVDRTVDRAAGMGACGAVIDGWCYRLEPGEKGPVVVTVRRAGSGPDIRAGFKRAGP